MFKTYTTQLFYALLFVSGCLYGADYNPEEYSALKPGFRYPAHKRSEDFDPLGLRAENAARRAEELQPQLTILDDEFTAIAQQYSIDLPSLPEATRTVTRISRQHPRLGRLINRIKNPAAYESVKKYPSRLLFVGPPGCGKTHAAMAVAKYCDAHCLFIKGSEVGDTYKNSGAICINKLFKALFERPEQPFIVIVDEFMTAAKFCNDDKDREQNKTAAAIWQALDECARNRHVCVIGTDNEDSEKIGKQLKSRFAHKIFTFEHMKQNDIVEIIKECLGYENITHCSDEFLAQLAKSVEHLPIREIEDLVEESRAYAIDESEDPKEAIITEQHLRYVFDEYPEPTGLKKIWKDRNKHLSARAIAAYMFTAGAGLKLYDAVRRDGFTLSTCGALLMGSAAILTYRYSENEKDSNDLSLFSMISHLFAQEESRRQWETSHELNVQNSKDAKDARDESSTQWKTSHKLNVDNAEAAQTARIEDKERIDQQDKKADDSASWDRIFRLHESFNQLSVELHNVHLQQMDDSDRKWIIRQLNNHLTYINTELITEYQKIHSQKDAITKKD